MGRGEDGRGEQVREKRGEENQEDRIWCFQGQYACCALSLQGRREVAERGDHLRWKRKKEVPISESQPSWPGFCASLFPLFGHLARFSTKSFWNPPMEPE
jgi:hypothetical protein